MALLGQLESVVSALDPALYTASPGAPVPGSVGGHVRHSLDHVRALLAATESGLIEYDRRRRGTPVETHPASALAAIADARSALSGWNPVVLRRAVTVADLLQSGAERIEIRSTLGRELAYVTSHTVHHHAIIGALVRSLGGSVPARFGYAASTLAWIESDACAR